MDKYLLRILVFGIASTLCIEFGGTNGYVIGVFLFVLVLYQITRKDEKEVRFQECSTYEKIMRYTTYGRLPFMWLYYTIIGGLPVIDDSDLSIDRIRGRMLWRILVGTIQSDIKYYYTQDEVMEELKKRRNKR